MFFGLIALGIACLNPARSAPASQPLLPPGSGSPGFTLLSNTQTGITFSNLLAQNRSLTNQIYLNGSGVALGDVDNDGRCDVYLCGLDAPNRLYRNLGNWRFEDITAAAGVACADSASTGAAFADLDGNGVLDLIVNTVGGGARVFLAAQPGRFRETSPDAGTRTSSGAMSLALADIDRDGDLDLYVVNYRPSTYRDEPNTRFAFRRDATGRPVLNSVNNRSVQAPDLKGRYTTLHLPDGRVAPQENGEEDALYLNDGSGRFARVSFTEGAFLDEDGNPLKEPPYDWGLSAVFHDFNRDQRPDLYVCNDFFSPDRLWLNESTPGGPVRFRAAPRLMLRHTPLFSMGIDIADVNRDGLDDFIALDMLSRSRARRLIDVGDQRPPPLPPGAVENRPQIVRNVLQLNSGDGGYIDVACFAGVAASEWSWTPVFLDVDLDGYEDLLITTGHERDSQNADAVSRLNAKIRASNPPPLERVRMRRELPSFPNPLVAFRNNGNLTFSDASVPWRFNLSGVAHGMAAADLDGDGDLDLVINRLNAEALVLRNDAPRQRLAVRLKGQAPNTQAVGARITVLGGPVPQSQTVRVGGRYLSSDDPLKTFATGNGDSFEIHVDWPSGQRSVVTKAAPGKLWILSESDAASASSIATKGADSSATRWFEDASSLIQHRHAETEFDESSRQPLLPWRQSQAGPGVVFADANGDGWDDLLITGPAGAAPSFFANDRQGGFAATALAWSNASSLFEHSAVLVLPGASNAAHSPPEWILAESSWEQSAETLSPMVRSAKIAAGNGQNLFQPILDPAGKPDVHSSALVALDFDSDGVCELFVGGHALPGRYPEPAPSRVLRRKVGGWEMDAALSAQFRNIGLVNGAVASDLNQDGQSELIVACEWGPVKIFRKGAKGWEQWNPEVRDLDPTSGSAALRKLSEHTGLWTGVATGDFDRDGRPDIVIGNWGLNSLYEATLQHPQELFFGDWDNSGSLDLLEARHDPALGHSTALRQLDDLSRAVPLIASRFASHSQYSTSSVQQILGDAWPTSLHLTAAELASVVLLNRGEFFELRRLPAPAQWSRVHGVVVSDWDGDGWDDLFLAQNFFAVRPEMGRMDGGMGLILRGDGKGGFTAAPGQLSGVHLYGEQRGAAAGDFDRDGRMDLVVAQNGSTTGVFRNRVARPGLRVRLIGSSGNPGAIGASIRLIDGAHAGPLREVQAGEGWRSQSSGDKILTSPARDEKREARQLEIRWPGGRRTVTAVPPSAREVSVDSTGAIRDLPR